MILLFVADPLETFKTYKDTTFSMMREAAGRGHVLWACHPADLVWVSGGQVTARGARRIALTGDEHDWFRTEETADLGLAAGTDAIIMRKDPPLTASSSTPPTCSPRPSARARASSTSPRPCATTPRSWPSWSFPNTSRPPW